MSEPSMLSSPVRDARVRLLRARLDILGDAMERVEHLLVNLDSWEMHADIPEQELQLAAMRLEAAQLEQELEYLKQVPSSLEPEEPAAEKPESRAVEWLTLTEAARRLGLPRTTLKAMVDKAPGDLPGAPMPVGEGKRRCHVRWDARTVDAWLAAYRDWDGKRAAPLGKGRRRGPRKKRARGAGADDGPVDWGAAVRNASKT
jgi:hypothetical protein